MSPIYASNHGSRAKSHESSKKRLHGFERPTLQAARWGVLVAAHIREGMGDLAQAWASLAQAEAELPRKGKN